MTAWDGDDYARRLDARLRDLEAAGGSPHGEADLVMSIGPDSVLDAGCGTGRVAIELAGRGVEIVGVDADPSMLSTAQRAHPDLEWILHDIGSLDLGRSFDVVLMAGNVPLFTRPGTELDLVRGAARHVASGGALVAGFQLDGRYTLEAYDDACAGASLVLAARYATWDGAPFSDGAGYAVSIHRRNSSEPG
ncbi:MAG: class I SAM-dependent methyltransferase [Acidimicrobiales bacterium]